MGRMVGLGNKYHVDVSDGFCKEARGNSLSL